MYFIYKAKSKDGEIFESTMEAENKFALLRELRSRNYTPISISEKKERFNPLEYIDSLLNSVKVQEQITFCRNLSGMLLAGLSLYRAISVIEKQTKNPVFLKILKSIKEEINAGGTLSSGLSRFPNVFSKLFVSMSRAGEESGNLPGALAEVGSNMEKSHSLKKKIKGALIYPEVILSAMVIIGILMFAFVVPTLAKTFKDVGAKMPASTRFIVALGDFFSQHLLWVFVILAITVVSIIFILRIPVVKKYIDFFSLKAPGVSDIVIKLNTARTARSMSALLSSGVSITRAIEITQDVVQNFYYKKILEQSKTEVEKGAPFSKIFEENPNLFPIMMSEMVEVGEETGKLSDMLLKVAVFYEEEIEDKMKNLATVIEPALMVFIGGAVGFFAVSMISPIYSVMDNIK